MTEAALPDKHTFRQFSAEQLAVLKKMRKELGPEVPRTLVKAWFNKNAARKWGPEWIVKNRFSVKKNAKGRGAICILDPELMPHHPFERVNVPKTKR